MKHLVCKCGGDQFTKAGMLHSVFPPWDGWFCVECQKVTFVSREEPHVYRIEVQDDAQILSYTEELVTNPALPMVDVSGIDPAAYKAEPK